MFLPATLLVPTEDGGPARQHEVLPIFALMGALGWSGGGGFSHSVEVRRLPRGASLQIPKLSAALSSVGGIY